MRILIFTPFLAALISGANPILFEDTSYMASEHATVAVSTNEARFEGRFVFKRLKAVDSDSKRLQIQVWFPEPERCDASGSNFWKAIGTRTRFKGTNAETVASLLDMKVQAGSSKLNASSAFFYDTSPPTTRRRPNAMMAPGYRTLLFTYSVPVLSIKDAQPVQISYRHPLGVAGNAGHFHYLPRFDGHPRKTSTSNTNDYAIAVKVATGCSASITNGSEIFQMGEGQTLVLSPAHLEPIDVSVVAAKPQSER